ncbi:uncharacterized protein LOC121390234 isoform X2 [Gigantopelta aegis]|uniref:uncharacterized protein LOC121390234 isoform X2 n=1 Tax=Gigantopelta aegis TaxID=1735272 RepID=UPI001B88E36D|nr:uncharacterized protein LOC121390234 isoform X2 [Gigantopelta aegis]
MTMNMNRTLAAVAIAFVMTVNSVQGGFSTRTGCLSPGITGQRSYLRCNISGLGDEEIFWYRPDGRVMATCSRHTCRTNENYTGQYHATMASPMEESAFLIKSFRPTIDVGTWTCRGKTGNYTSCEKRGGFSTRTGCLSPGITGQRSYLRCNISGLGDEEIFWYRPDGRVMATCSRHTCRTNENYTGQYHAMMASPMEESAFLINSFRPTIDVGTWTCRGKTGNYTSCEKRGGFSTRTGCLSPGITGQRSYLRCNISGLGDEEIFWYRPDGRVMATCSRHTCRTNKNYTGQYHAMMASPMEESDFLIKSFRPTIDVGTWTCRGKTGNYTSCEKRGGFSTRTGCLSPGITGQRSYLRCNISGLGDEEIFWYRPDGRVMATCSRHTCRTSENYTGQYHAMMASPMEESAFLINSFRPTIDVGTWTCRGKTGNYTSCEKRGGLSTRTSCLSPGITGQRSYLRCNISGLGDEEIFWYRPDGRVMATCSRHTCRTNTNYTGQYHAIMASPMEESAFLIKSFRPIIDLGTWTCRGKTGNYISCEKRGACVPVASTTAFRTIAILAAIQHITRAMFS